MKIVEVKSKKDIQDFLELPVRLYKNNPDWSQPLDKDIEAVFDLKQNKFFRHGQCSRFILFDDESKVIGRVAAFINDRTSKKEEVPTGGMGFFECINDRTAAFMLFEHCKKWLSDRGMEAMDGPINFGERDSWWGLIVKGFTPVPYKMNYNPPYYQELFEAFGFQTWFEQWCYSLTVQDRPAPKFYERHAALSTNPDYRAEHLKKNQLDKYAEDFRIVYNKAWAKHGGGKELDPKQVRLFFRKMKPVMDEKVIWYVYYRNEPVAMWVNLPDINQLFRQFKGKFGWLEKIRFVYMLRRRRIRKFIGLVFGVVPEQQGKGIDAYMIIEVQA